MLLRLIVGTLFFLSVFHQHSNAQVFNVDREAVPDSSYGKWAFAAGVSLATDKQKSSISNLSSNIELDRFLQNNYLLIAALKMMPYSLEAKQYKTRV